MQTEDLLRVVDETIRDELASSADTTGMASILVVDELGVTSAEALRSTTTGLTTQVLMEHVKSGALGAAYVSSPSQRPGLLMVELVVRDPCNSEVRSASFRRVGDGGIEIGEWTYLD